MSEVCLPLPAECLAHQLRDCGHYPLWLWKNLRGASMFIAAAVWIGPVIGSHPIPTNTVICMWWFFLWYSLPEICLVCLVDALASLRHFPFFPAFSKFYSSQTHKSTYSLTYTIISCFHTSVHIVSVQWSPVWSWHLLAVWMDCHF